MVFLQVLRVLEDLLSWEEDWEVRQSALKGLKYCLALVPGPYDAELAETVSRIILRGFRDADDVRASAADAALLWGKRLATSSDVCLVHKGGQGGGSDSEFTRMLWESLDDCDEVSTATAPILSLLAYRLAHAAPHSPRTHTDVSRIVSTHESAALSAELQQTEDFEELFGEGLCRLRSLFKFFRHNLATVRKATVSILAQVVGAHPSLLHYPCSTSSTPGDSTIPEETEDRDPFAVEALEVLFLNALIEARADVVADTEALWKLVLVSAPRRVLASLVGSVGQRVGGQKEQEAGGAKLRKWIRAAATPIGQLLSPQDVCSNSEYLECITMFASYHSSAAPVPRKKSKGSKSVMAAEPQQPGGGNKYDIGSATREVACRMISGMSVSKRLFPPLIGLFTSVCRSLLLVKWSVSRSPLTFVHTSALLCVASAPAGGAEQMEETGAGIGAVVLESLLSSSNVWVRFVGSWVALETSGLAEACLRIGLSGGGIDKGREGDGGLREGGGGLRGEGCILLSGSAIKLLSTLAQWSEVKEGDPVQRDTAGFAAGCLLSATPVPQQQSDALVIVLLKCLAQQADAIVQRRSSAALVHAARLGRLSSFAALLLYSQVCCDPSITPLSFSALASSSAAIALGTATYAMSNVTMALGVDRDSQPRGGGALEGLEEEVSVEMVLRNVPTRSAGMAINVDVSSHEEVDRLAIRARQICQRGAQWVLEIGADVLGENVFDCLPCLWEQSGGVLEAVGKVGAGAGERGNWEKEPDEMIKALQLVEVLLLGSASGAGRRLVGSLLCALPHLLQSGRAALRHMSARSLARAAAYATNPTMEVLVREVLPMLQETASGSARLGAIEAVFRTIELLGEQLLPYAVLLVTPVLACMSDAHAVVREAATRSFASLLQALPLERGVPDPEGLSADLVAGRIRERRFLEQLWDPSQLEPYAITANLSVALRPYQREGVNWLGFLIRFQLHGILCDDMGLGKTLQTIAVLASDVMNRRATLRESTQGAADRQQNYSVLPSLIVCPTTLVQHWCHEIEKFCPDLTARPYSGTAQERQALIHRVKASDDVLIISYEATISLKSCIHGCI